MSYLQEIKTNWQLIIDHFMGYSFLNYPFFKPTPLKKITKSILNGFNLQYQNVLYVHCVIVSFNFINLRKQVTQRNINHGNIKTIPSSIFGHSWQRQGAKQVLSDVNTFVSLYFTILSFLGTRTINNSSCCHVIFATRNFPSSAY